MKPGAFLPSPVDLATSAFWTDALAELEIWHIGDEIVAKPRGRVSLARAEFGPSIVSDAKLTLESDPEPHPRHVVLRGWPTEKDKQKSIAVELSSRSLLRVRNVPAPAES